MNPHNLITLTGGPGSGKTSVLQALEKVGWCCVNEAGRFVIQQNLETLGDALPWQNKIAFRDAMLQQDLLNYATHKHSEKTVFFDRGIIDVYGYSLLENLPLSTALLHACEKTRYHPCVFIFPPWEEIYCNDTERKQTFKEAIATYQKMQEAYMHWGYHLVEVPKVSIDQRIIFISETLKAFRP